MGISQTKILASHPIQKTLKLQTNKKYANNAQQNLDSLHSVFFYKNNFIRTKALVLAKNLRTS